VTLDMHVPNIFLRSQVFRLSSRSRPKRGTLLSFCVVNCSGHESIFRALAVF